MTNTCLVPKCSSASKDYHKTLKRNHNSHTASSFFVAFFISCRFSRLSFPDWHFTDNEKPVWCLHQYLAFSQPCIILLVFWVASIKQFYHANAVELALNILTKLKHEGSVNKEWKAKDRQSLRANRENMFRYMLNLQAHQEVYWYICSTDSASILRFIKH